MATESVSIIIKAFDQTQKALRGIKRAFAGLSKIFFNFKTALVAAVGAGGMGLLIANSLKATDALAKTAGRIGTTTDALSKLQYAGDLSGLSVETMNMALQRFTRRVSEAAIGTGEARGALKELNLDANELNRMTLDQKVLALSDAFTALPNRLNDTRLAMKLFDSEGVAMVNMLLEGSDSLKGMFNEAELLGAVMTQDAAKGVEDANNAITRMMAVSKGLIAQFSAALAPAITLVANSMFDFTTKTLASKDGVRGFAIEAAANFLQFIAATLDNLEKLAKGVRIAFNAFVVGANIIMPVFDVIGAAFDLLINSIKRKLNVIVQATGFIDRALKKLGFEEVFNFEKFKIEPIKFTITQLEKMGEIDFGDTADGLREVASVVRDTKNAATETQDALTNLVPPSTPIADFLEQLQTMRTSGDDVRESLLKLGDKALDGLGKSFTDAITGAQKFSDAIKNMAKSVIDSLIQMLIQKYIVDAAFGFITNMISPTGADGAPILKGPDGIEFGPAENYVGKARGGPVTGGRPYVVGEKGPELMVPSGNGSIVPNNQLGGGGVTVVQNINVTTGVQQTVRAEIANLLPQISNAAKSAVADARMRGGGFSKAMVGA